MKLHKACINIKNTDNKKQMVELIKKLDFKKGNISISIEEIKDSCFLEAIIDILRIRKFNIVNPEVYIKEKLTKEVEKIIDSKSLNQIIENYESIIKKRENIINPQDDKSSKSISDESSKSISDESTKSKEAESSKTPEISMQMLIDMVIERP